MIEINGLTKKYGRNLILDQPSLHLSEGIHLLEGPNGSGKSTLLKILAGMIPFKGQIKLNGHIQLNKDHKAHRLAVSLCEAEPEFPPYLSGNYMIQLFAKLKKAPQEQIQELQARLGITYADQKISTYSSGMNKKLGILLSFLGKPSLILLDEPFATLDQAAKAGLKSLVQERRAEGCSFILATHVASTLSDLTVDYSWKISDHQLFAKHD